MKRTLLWLLVPVALLALPAGLLLSENEPPDETEEKPSTIDPVHHALIQRRVGMYAVYLPPDYHDHEDRTWPVCVILHGHGSTETGHGGLSNSFGRDGVIYVAPRAPYMHKGLIEQSRTGYTAWPTYTEGMDAGAENERLEVSRLYTDWIAACVADVRERYRADDQRVVVVGHSQGAMYSLTLALQRPELVRAHFAYAGYYWGVLEDDIAAQTLKKHDIYTFVSHCDGDPVVNSESAHALVEYLKEHEVPHDSLFVEAEVHGFTSAIMRAGQEFVALWCRGEELPPLKGELVVAMVVEDSVAAGAGIRAGDVLTAYDGHALSNLDDLQAAVAKAESEGKESVEITWRRGDTAMKASVKSGRLGVILLDR
jgi:predicted esterase